MSQKMAISAGIGLFLGIIALKDCRLVVADKETLVTLGDLKSAGGLLAAAGFVVMVALDRLAVPGAIIIAVLATAAAGILFGVSPFAGIAAMPPSLAPTFLALDLRGALDLGLVTIVFVFLFVDLFDNTGTLIGVAHRAGLLDRTAACRAPAGLSASPRWRRWAARCSAPRPSPATSRAPPG